MGSLQNQAPPDPKFTDPNWQVGPAQQGVRRYPTQQEERMRMQNALNQQTTDTNARKYENQKARMREAGPGIMTDPAAFKIMSAEGPRQRSSATAAERAGSGGSQASRAAALRTPGTPGGSSYGGGHENWRPVWGPSGPGRSSYGATQGSAGSPGSQWSQQGATAAELRNAGGGPGNSNEIGSPNWQNPMYNPTQNDNGYTRFDYTKYGSGLERARNYADGARIYDTYGKLTQGQPGYDHHQKALSWLAKSGINPAQATDQQKFEAMDNVFRGTQYDNQKSNKFNVGSILGPVLTIGGGLIGGPLGAAAGSAVGSAATGGNVGDIALSGAKGYVGNQLYG